MRLSAFDTPTVTVSMMNFDILESGCLQQGNGLMLFVILQIGRVQLVIDDEPSLSGGHRPPNLVQVPH